MPAKLLGHELGRKAIVREADGRDALLDPLRRIDAVHLHFGDLIEPGQQTRAQSPLVEPDFAISFAEGRTPRQRLISPYSGGKFSTFRHAGAKSHAEIWCRLNGPHPYPPSRRLAPRA